MKNTADVNEKILSSMMVGREVIFDKIEKTGSPADVMIEARNLFVTDNRGLMAVEGVNLQVRSGEILGIAAVEGNGQSELVEAIAGMRQPEKGECIYAAREPQEWTRAKSGSWDWPTYRRTGSPQARQWILL